ncbi:MAG: IS4 family transposase [Candidatus Syntrophoarchaeum sp.]|nr:IS4 family transposase [Candidatus Syntrophoarchaeum sp.]
MQTHTYCQETLLELFNDTGLNPPKPLKTMLSLLIVALLENNKAHPSVLAECLAITGITVIARIQRIRRFLSNEKLSPAITVVPLIRLIRPLLSNAREIVLAMDRTDWDKRRKHVNILSVAICYKGRAIPVFWIVLDRKGNSSFKHWKQVLTPVIEGLQQTEGLSGIPIHVVADREFASPKLAEWLKKTYGVDATLRMKASMYLKGDGMSEIKIATVLQRMVKGSRRVFYDQIVTQDSTFKMNVVLNRGKEYEEAMVVATTVAKPHRAELIYGGRFGIEAMHKDWKSNAFELEKTRVTDTKRIETLLIPIAFAYVLCVFEGENKEESGDVRVPPKGKERTVGLFLSGLRSISTKLRRDGIKQFRIFFRNLLKPFCKAWKIPAFA